jgi:SAM-dependent methyltransferase
LARAIIAHLDTSTETIRVLDPACGDGGLLLAFAESLPEQIRKKTTLVGYDRDTNAIDEAKELLGHLDVRAIDLREADFLEDICKEQTYLSQRTLFGSQTLPSLTNFDAVISNPPYVRTQVLGAERAQELAVNFGLTGRVDLYQAFTIGMTSVLKHGGILGLLTSNRFLFTQSGAELRRHLRTEYELKAIYDLGDTKLFSAAVLPAIVVGKKDHTKQQLASVFDRVYEYRSKNITEKSHLKFLSVLEALQNDAQGVVQTPKGLFSIERGNLAPGNDIAEPWTLVSGESKKWLQCLNSNQECTFDDVAKIRVGIKTTADKVFIRSDWGELPSDISPEFELLNPLIRHTDATRWKMTSGEYKTKVLYPYKSGNDKRIPVDLEKFPRCKNYLESHAEQLKCRKYVIESGREWYEIWVPHSPKDWMKPKVVFPDISEGPKFFLDTSGAIVNGDCYWITLRENKNQDWLYLLLAVANSSFIIFFYDTVFHNKLYAGRRRFMTQYVKKFPLPNINSAISKEIIDLVKQLVSNEVFEQETASIEEKLDNLVWQSFGLEKTTR